MTNQPKRRGKLTIRVESTSTWIVTDRLGGQAIGGVSYQHDVDGNHYRPWQWLDGVREYVGAPVPQLALAIQAIENGLS